MTLRAADIAFDCEDALVVGRFWSTALRRPLDPDPSSHFASIGRADPDPGQPNWFFAAVPEKRAAKNRVHVDLEADDMAAEVDRLLELGATHLADKSEYGHVWTVLQDPEGNEFCVSGPHA
jgi:predicted enzyme related to lactoylglutathione lyase